MKSIHDIRRENLRTIIQKDFDGRQIRMAEALGFQANLISRWMASPDMASAKNIGGSSARKIEAAARRPAFWLDTDHGMAIAAEAEPLDANTEIGIIAAQNLTSWMQANKELKSQAAVAEKAEVGQSTVNRLLNREASISINNLAAIAAVFNRRAYELLIPPHDETVIQYDRSRYAALPAEEKAKIKSFIDFVMSENTK
ncbi:helix-turn-helix domain-containing protein [Rahnella inusitata]|uniref:helix-turn-helix domain-containing protein n=1 Tax=Rahnella inusitata TaxID=58169 RepID=UPI0039BE6B38